MPGMSLQRPGIPGIPWARPCDPRGCTWDARARHWDPGTPLGRLGTPLGPPREAPKTPRVTYGHISTNRQRQKLSIAVFEAAHEGPSHGALDRADFL